MVCDPYMQVAKKPWRNGFFGASFAMPHGEGLKIWAKRILFRYNENQRRHGALKKPERQSSSVELITGSMENARKNANDDNPSFKAEQMLRAQKNR